MNSLVQRLSSLIFAVLLCSVAAADTEEAMHSVWATEIPGVSPDLTLATPGCRLAGDSQISSSLALKRSVRLFSSSIRKVSLHLQYHSGLRVSVQSGTTYPAHQSRLMVLRI
jgi:hypothetical protein